jgi:hypothetical protein
MPFTAWCQHPAQQAQQAGTGLAGVPALSCGPTRITPLQVPVCVETNLHGTGGKHSSRNCQGSKRTGPTEAMAASLTTSLVRAPFTASRRDAGLKACTSSQRMPAMPGMLSSRAPAPAHPALKLAGRRSIVARAETETAAGAWTIAPHHNCDRLSGARSRTRVWHYVRLPCTLTSLACLAL